MEFCKQPIVTGIQICEKIIREKPWQFNGSPYEGALKDGEKIGIVTFNSVKSSKFVGECKNDKKCSHG